MNRGVIKQFRGSWSSGIAYLDIEDSETQIIQSILCENTSTVRALEAAFGNTITIGHTANGDGYKDREISWHLDGMGLLLEWFAPVEEP